MFSMWLSLHTFLFLLLQVMTMMFEVQDLAVASPATVSRCGMVYLEPSILGLSPFVHCWLQSLPEAIVPHREKLQTLFVNFLEVPTCTLDEWRFYVHVYFNTCIVLTY